MRRVKIGAAALNQTPLDWEGNYSNIDKAIQAAKAEGVQILCLPELCITGYGCEDQFQSPHVINTAYSILKRVATLTKDMLLAVGLPVLHNGALYNTVAVINHGVVTGLIPKRYLANDGVHYEHRWFKPWPRGVVHRFHRQIPAPIGDMLIDYGEIKVGIEVCEDAWAANRVGAKLACNDAKVILNPSASHFAFGKFKDRVNIVEEGSRSLNVAYAYANLLGNESGRTIYDGDTLIANDGRIVASGERFSFKDVILTSAVVDLDVNIVNRMKLDSYDPDYKKMPSQHTLFYPTFSEEHVNPPIDLKFDSNFEEFTRAITLGMFDYMRKTRSNGFVVSLSGGADSSAAACLTRLIPLYGKLSSEEDFDKKMVFTDADNFLTCIYQPTENSSDTTKMAAYALANELGAQYIELDVTSVVNKYVEMVSEALGRPLQWNTDDIALQNIQARARAPGAWMFANINKAILLATSNRSEAAVGYATMDGDTCGGLSPLAGIDKDFLIQWLIWARNKFDWNSLDLVIKQKPTAELRPEKENQSDESDLMPYDLLDKIEGLAIRDKKPPLEVFKNLENEGYDSVKLGGYIEKFFKLWCRNQWKRERYAPSLHVDDKNLDPRSWCRFPILSSGFREEIRAMWRHIDTSGSRGT